MANVKYYLANNNKRGDKLIMLFFNYDGRRLQYSTGETINSNSWNPESQRVKKSITGSSEINDYLDKLGEDVKKIYRNLKTNDESISPENLKEKLDKERSNIKKDKPTFFSFTEEYINSVVSLRKTASITVYRNTLQTLKDYKDYSRKRIDFDSIDLDFYNGFSEYLTKEKKFKPNTIGKHIKTLKTFMSEATERGLNKNLDFKSKKFKVIQEDSDTIYLDEKEIDVLYGLDLKKNERLDRVRDLFLIGCYTGLRFSDFSQLKPENITNGIIKIRTVKTNETIVIPVHERVSKIMLKYKNSLPETITNQKMNDYLKEIGEKAKLNDKIEKIDNKEGLRVTKFVKKYDLITTHTARRSFATNLFKKGFPAISIMKITGHKTEKAFMRYIKITSEQNAELLVKFWSENSLLKVKKNGK
jgi:integrase